MDELENKANEIINTDEAQGRPKEVISANEAVGQPKEIKGICPNCGKEISIEDGIDVFFCKYCGTKIDVKTEDQIKAEEEAKLEKYKRPKEPLTLRRILFNPIVPALIFLLFGLGVVWYATKFKM